MTDLAKNEIKAARAVASQIRDGIRNYFTTLALIRRAWEERHWEILGYDSWQEYVDTEYSAERLRVPAEHRQKAVQELRLAGMSVRAIAASTGTPKSTVADEMERLSEAGQLDQPDRARGLDDRERPATQTPARRDPEPTSGGPAIATTGGPDPDPVADLIANDPDVQAADYMARFSTALARAGGWMQFDAERVATSASPTTWAAIESHAEVVAHTYERMRKARSGLRVIKGGVA